MKVKISLTVEVDPEVWAMNYGTSTAAETRADVQNLVQATIFDMDGIEPA